MYCVDERSKKKLMIKIRLTSTIRNIKRSIKPPNSKNLDIQISKVIQTFEKSIIN